MEDVDHWVDEFLPIVTHTCTDRCLRLVDDGDELTDKCRVPYYPPAADTWFDQKPYSSMSEEVLEILGRYGVERTAYRGVYKYRTSTSKCRLSPQIPTRAWAIESNCNVLACDNQGNEHAYLTKYVLKQDQLSVWDHRKKKIGSITEANGHEFVRAENYAKPRYLY